jgi:aspartyl-tRNA(Asn)/glutamyl-tRNA(Gln) amidotransferase subunit C
MITDAEVDKIATLARIELTDALRERMKKDLSSVLDYIALLDEADTSGIEPLYQVTGLQNVTRPDEPRAKLVPDEKITELLVNQAPAREGRYLKVKAVRHS